MRQVTIVSNRLPVSVKKVNGKLEFYQSDGGLARGLEPYTKNKNSKWVGWPGLVSEELSKYDRQEIGKELAKHNCYPVFLTKKQIDGYYNGYSNGILWPLFHNMTVGLKSSDKYWSAYRQVNQLFAEAALDISPRESAIWIHDYQLMLVPEIIRRRRPHDPIGFFLHTPFPSGKVFGNLPHAKSLLKGLVGAGVIGFHTSTYVRDFLDQCQKLNVGISSPGQIILGDRVVHVTHFPLGIDYDKFSQAGNDAAIRRRTKEYRKKYGRRKIILTVDRLDPTKGLVERLNAYKELLGRDRRFHKKVVMVMLAVPTRKDIKAYKRLKEKVESLITDINDTYGRRGWQPVHYIYDSLPFEEVAALYQIADVAFIAPIKDGMNLVAKEYVASKPGKKGVLILSKTAGAAQELTDALLVNPRQPKSLLDGLTDALIMRPKELKKRLASMQTQLSSNTIHHWTKKFVGALEGSSISLQQRTKRLTAAELDLMMISFKQAKRPAILLDYDGVLVPFVGKPSTAKPPMALLNLLKNLTTRVSGRLLIISGRSREDLDTWLGNVGVNLAAEHGALLRSSKSSKWRKTIDVPSNWKRLVLPTLQKYADKTPGAFVEEKECSVVWHYRQALPFYVQKHIAVLLLALKPLLKNTGINVYRGNMILELKPKDANKGKAVTSWLGHDYDFIVAIGDDYTDEDVFAALPPSAYTIKVGRGKTLARFRLSSVDGVHTVLTKLAKS